MFDAAHYTSQLRALLPQGAAWPQDEDSALAKLLGGIADELARVDARCDDLLEEADPRTTLELLADWERVTGLPDACFGAPDNIPERQVAVASRVTGLGGQSRAYFIEIAASMGYPISIDEFHQSRCGDRVGVYCHHDEWAHIWRVNVLPIVEDIPEGQFYLAQARCGDRLGVRLRGWGAINLECLVDRYKPAQTIVLFSYQVEPAALLWFDFTH